MDIDTHFPQPDPSAAVPMPIVPTDPPQSGKRAQAAMLIAGALIAVAGVFVLGRWTTGGERDALASERDAARQERSALGARVSEVERDLAGATAKASDDESAIADLQQAAADDARELNRQRTLVAVAAKRNGELEDSNRAQWDHIAAVSECGTAVTAADTEVEKWNAMLKVLHDYSNAVPGSPEEADLGERLDQAFQDIDDADTEFTAASTRCTSALGALPNCDGERKTMEVAVEAFKAKNDRAPDSEDELVAAGFIKQPVDDYDMTNGEVTPVAGSPCPSAA